MMMARPRSRKEAVNLRRMLACIGFIYLYLLEAISKIGFWFKVKAAAMIKPEEYIRYFEDLIRAPNAEIGPKDIFEIASRTIIGRITEVHGASTLIWDLIRVKPILSRP